MNSVLMQLVRALYQVDDQITLEDQVTIAMKRFDHDNTGTISFPNFVRMITKRPWSQLLPAKSQAVLNKM